MKEDTQQTIQILIPVTVSVFGFICMNVIYNISILGFHGISYLSLNCFILSVFLGIVVYTFLLGLFKKSSKATLVYSLLLLFLNIICYFKIMYTQEPIFFSDFLFVNDIGNISKLAASELNLSHIICFFIGILFVVVLYIINRKFDLSIKSKKNRLKIIILDICVCIVLFMPCKYTKELYLNLFLNNNKHLDYQSYTSDISYYANVGMLNGMYGKLLNDRFSEPENYNKKEIEEMLKSSNNIEPKMGKPDIIVMFSESFFNIDDLDEIKFNKTVAKNFNNLKNEGNLINVITPTYGGLSENVAFELLTGGNMSYFNKGYIPVMSLYSRRKESIYPSIVKVLKENGYYSKILFGLDYYRSEKTFKKIGFDDYEELDEKYETLNDEMIIDKAINDISKMEEDKNYFYFIETIEAHMPFNKAKYDDYKVYVTQSNFSERENETINAYAQSIHNSDKQLGRLYEYIQTREKPTILVFLGDHLPYLYYGSNKNVIDDLNYFNTGDELTDYYRRYNTQALILANFDMNDVDIPKYSGDDLLLTNLINQMNIKNNDYYKWINSNKEIISGYNKFVSVDQEGNLYYTKDLNGDMKETFENKRKMQYYFFIE